MAYNFNNLASDFFLWNGNSSWQSLCPTKFGPLINIFYSIRVGFLVFGSNYETYILKERVVHTHCFLGHAIITFCKLLPWFSTISCYIMSESRVWKGFKFCKWWRNNWRSVANSWCNIKQSPITFDKITGEFR